MNKIIAGILMLSFSFTSFAESTPTGFFLGAGIGKSTVKFDGESESDQSTQFVIGYTPNDIVSFSIGTKDFGSMNDSWSYRDDYPEGYFSGWGSSSLSVDGIPLTLDLNIPVNNSFAFRFQLGYLKWKAQLKGSTTWEDSWFGEVTRNTYSYNEKLADGTDFFYGAGITTRFESSELLFGYTRFKLDQVKVNELQLMFKFYP